jgi:hypothetical protein
VNFESFFTSATTPVLLTGAFLAFLSLIFLVFFLIPGALHWLRLRSIQQRIKAFEAKDSANEFKKAFSKDSQLAHLWKEYQDSLHIQYEERDGQLAMAATRATVPSELYFNTQFVVDSRLRTEFFKHVPGLFTGIGIIGTFSGLIEGLRVFQVSENAATVRASLESLMHLVGEAFLVSAAAICAAMVVTFIEKLLLASLYRQTEEIAHAIDARFDSGAGEEYLARLVRASEDSASQSKILKDALVKELGELLRELTSAQISSSNASQQHLEESLLQASRAQVEASKEANKALGATIAESIQQSLQGPLQDIATTVKAASGDQSATAARMLQDVMASFSQRLNDLFGGQISGLSELNQQTANSIQQAVGTLQTLVANIEASNQRSTDAMAERMARAIENMEARQEEMNAQSGVFVEEIRRLLAVSQSETNAKLQSTLESIGTQVSSMLGKLNTSQQAAFEQNTDRENNLTAHTSNVVASMSASVEAALKEMSAASAQMAQSVAVLTQATSSSIDKMNAGAEQLGSASRNFATAGDRVTGVLTQTAAVTSKLSETSGALATGAAALQTLLGDYRIQRDAVGQLVTELRSTVDLARKEAALTGDVLARIESSASRLGAAQKQADEYLAGVSKVLGEAHTTFATEIRRTLDKANTEFHNKLGAAVGLLSSGVQELEVTLASMGGVTAPTRK